MYRLKISLRKDIDESGTDNMKAQIQQHIISVIYNHCMRQAGRSTDLVS